MEGAYQVPDILLERDWAIKMDLRHGKNRLLPYELISCFIAYYHVPMDPEHSNCLSFVWNGSLYRFLTMCFGIKNAPFIFDRLGRTMIRYLLFTWMIYWFWEDLLNIVYGTPSLLSIHCCDWGFISK